MLKHEDRGNYLRYTASAPSEGADVNFLVVDDDFREGEEAFYLFGDSQDEYAKFRAKLIGKGYTNPHDMVGRVHWALFSNDRTKSVYCGKFPSLFSIGTYWPSGLKSQVIKRPGQITFGLIDHARSTDDETKNNEAINAAKKLRRYGVKWENMFSYSSAPSPLTNKRLQGLGVPKGNNIAKGELDEFPEQVWAKYFEPLLP